jgi:hypothetical protein
MGNEPAQSLWHTHPKNTFANIKKISRILLKISLGALNKDPTGWLDRARHANTSIPPSFLSYVPAQQCGIPIPKNTFANIKIGRILLTNQPRSSE